MEAITSLISQEEFTINRNKGTEQDIIKRLREDGIVIIPDFIHASDLEKLNIEFEILVKTKEKGIKPFQLEKGEGVDITRNKFEAKKYPFTSWLFGSPFMSSIVKSYVHPTARCNSKVYAIRDVIGTTTYANDLHYDVQKCLKFFLYLNDVTANNGAFEFVGRTHKWVENLRRSDQAKKITFKNREFSRQLPVNEEHIIPLEAKAGTLFIFDTDIFHRTGKTSMGERKIMRGHTYFDEVKDKDPIFAKTV